MSLHRHSILREQRAFWSYFYLGGLLFHLKGHNCFQFWLIYFLRLTEKHVIQMTIPCHNFRHEPSYKRQKKAPFILSYISITEYYLKTYSLIIKSLTDSALFCLQFWIFVQSAVKERILKWPYKVYFIFFS